MMEDAGGEQTPLHPCNREMGERVPPQPATFSPVARSAEDRELRSGRGDGTAGLVPRRGCWLWAGEGTAIGWLGRGKRCFEIQL